MSDTAEALFLRARARDLAGRDLDARQGYLDALSLDMAHAGALNSLGTLLARAGCRSAARLCWRQATERCPDDAAAHVHLGNLLREDGDRGAEAAYREALFRDPELPEAHQGLALILDGAEAAAWHRDRGFGPRALTTAPYRGTAAPIEVLQVASCRGGNIPTRLLLPDTRFRVHTVFAEYADRVADVPPHHVAFNAIGDADFCPDALADAARLLGRARASVLNRPAAVLASGRADNAARLGRLPGVVAPRVAMPPRADFAAHGLGYPVLARAPGFHTGRHFVRADTAEALPALLATLPGETLLAIQFLDARGPDGLFRKYRAMLIGGRIFPLHLAVSRDWKVHYYTADMTAPEHRAEEAAFLGDMAGTIGPAAMDALARIAETLDLDYAGVDFAVTPEGHLLLFEANATMVVAQPPPEPRFAARRAAASRVLDAVHALIAGHAV
jgi:hypothetical protein